MPPPQPGQSVPNAIPSSPGSSLPGELHARLRWSLRLLLRHRILLAAIVALFLVPTFIWLQRVTPRYTADATILIESPDTAGSTLLDRTLPVQARLSESVVQTEASVLASTPLLRRVIAKLQLDKDPEFNPALREPGLVRRALAAVGLAGTNRDAGLSEETRNELALALVVSTLRRELEIRPSRRSFVIGLQFTSEDRQKAARIANAIADMYVLDRLEAGFDETRRVTDWLSGRLEQLRRELERSEAIAEAYRSEHGLRRKGERQATVNDQQLTEINSRLVVLRAELAQKQARLEQARALTRGARIDTSYDVLQSPLIQRLREQEAVLQREISDNSKTYGERHPKLVGMQADLAELRRKIGQEVEKVAASLQNEVVVAQTGVTSLEQQLDALGRRSDVAGGAEIRLRELERQTDASRALYEAFLGRFKHDAEQERIQRANARVLSPADIPRRPSFPNALTTLFMMAVLGGMAAVAVVFLLDWSDDKVRSSDDAEALADLPVRAVVPLAAGDTPERALIDEPHGALADAIRNLRAALAMSDAPRGGKVVLVTSSTPREGKSFVALCLARMFSRTEKRVLLIDADIHRPRLHTALGVGNEQGLVQLLQDEASLDGLLQTDPVTGIAFLPAGTRATPQQEILDAVRLEQLIAMLAVRFDRIVIDSPPVLAVTDARVLSRMADQVLYLIRWNATPRDAVRNGLKLLRAARAPLTGIVLSQVDTKKHGRYGYGDYGHYYGRYREYYGK